MLVIFSLLHTWETMCVSIWQPMLNVINSVLILESLYSFILLSFFVFCCVPFCFDNWIDLWTFWCALGMPVLVWIAHFAFYSFFFFFYVVFVTLFSFRFAGNWLQSNRVCAFQGVCEVWVCAYVCECAFIFVVDLNSSLKIENNNDRHCLTPVCVSTQQQQQLSLKQRQAQHTFSRFQSKNSKNFVVIRQKKMFFNCYLSISHLCRFRRRRHRCCCCCRFCHTALSMQCLLLIHRIISTKKKTEQNRDKHYRSLCA